MSSSTAAAAALQCYSLSGLQPGALLRLLADTTLGLADADYGCRVAAAAVTCEVLGALQDVARCTQACGDGDGGDGAASQQQQQWAGSVADAVLHLLEPVITAVLMPVAGKQLPGFRGKALVGGVLAALGAVTRGWLVPAEEWTAAWAAIGGTFWLSRLCRDREASIRRAALNLTAALLAPERSATQALITANWPDCVHRLLRVAGDATEAYGVRAAAMRGLAAALVLPLDTLQPRDAQSSEGDGVAQGGAAAAAKSRDRPARMHGFGFASLLQAEQVWQQLLPGLLSRWQQLPAALAGGAAVLAAAAVAADPDGVGRQLLLQPGLATTVLQLAAAAGDGSSSSSVSGRTAAAAAAAAAPMPQQQQYLLHLEKLAVQAEGHASSGRCEPPAAGLSSAVTAAGWAGKGAPASSPAGWWVQQLVASLAVQEAIDQLDAAAAALQLLAAAAAPASAGGGLLQLPAAVQAVVQAAPTAAAQLIVDVGDSLAQQERAARGGDGGSGQQPAAVGAGQLLSLQQQQLTAVGAAAAALAAQAGAWPAEQRRQRLLQLLARRGHAGGAGETTGQRLLCAAATCLGHPACSDGLRLALTQLLGLLLSDADAAAAALTGGGGPSTHPETSCGLQDATATPVGAVLCRELAARLPASIFTPTTSLAAADPGAAAAAAAAAVHMVGSSEAWAAAAGAAPATGGMAVAPPEGLVVVFALQNLLAFSTPAKAAAVEAGLHTLLLSAVAHLAAAVAGATTAAVAQPSGGRVRARWFSTPAAGAGASAGGGGAKKTGTVSVAFGRTSGALELAASLDGSAGPGAASKPAQHAGKLTPPAASASARKAASLSLRGASSRGSAATISAARVKLHGAATQQQQREGGPQGAAPEGAEQPEEEERAPQDAGSGGEQQHGGELPVEQPAVGTTTTTQQQQLQSPAAPAGTAAAVPAAGLSKQQLAAAARALNLRKLLLSVVLLRHLAFGCSDTQAALTGEGLVNTLLHLWPLAVQHQPLLLELCRLLSNTLPSCYEARLAAANLPGPSLPPVCGAPLLHCALALLLGQQQPQLHQQAAGGVAAAAAAAPAASAAASEATASGAAFAAAAATPAVVVAAGRVLLGFASTDDGAAQLVKAGASCLPEVARAVRGCVLAARRESPTPPQRQLNGERLSGLLQLLAVLAGRPEGQTALLRPTVGPVVVELVVEVLQLAPGQQPVASAPAAALLLLRNLSFCAELSGPLLAHAAGLPLLLAAAEALAALMPGGARTRLAQRLGLADEELLAGLAAAGGSGDGCSECRPPKWAPLYGRPATAGGTAAGSRGGAAAAAAATAAAGGGGGSPSAPLAAAVAAGGISGSRSGSPARGTGGAAGIGGSSVPGAVGNVCCAVYAASALWSLTHSGEKAKAALRRLPAAVARLNIVREQAEQLLRLHQQQQKLAAVAGGKQQQRDDDGDGRGAVADTAAVQDVAKAPAGGLGSPGRQQQQRAGSRLGPQAAPAPGKQLLMMMEQQQQGGDGAITADGMFVQPGSVCAARPPAWWLQQLRDSCGMLLTLLESV